jgi:hypothetical protein
MPIDNAKLPVSDLDVPRRFYTAALAPIGWRLAAGDWRRPLGRSLRGGRWRGGRRAVVFERTSEPIVGCHIAFLAFSRDQVDRFHVAAVAVGGIDNGAPGERPYGPA